MEGKCQYFSGAILIFLMMSTHPKIDCVLNQKSAVVRELLRSLASESVKNFRGSPNKLLDEVTMERIID
jgi:hypothetical protein